MILPACVRKVGELISVIDVIKYVTAPNSHAWMEYNRALNKYPALERSMVKERSKRNQPIILSDEATVEKMVRITLARKRYSVTRVKEILDTLGMSSDFYITGLMTPESEWVHVLKDAFQDYTSETQYPCGLFNIDLYFVDKKVAVECDEHGHKWKEGNDEEREKQITDTLDCRWVRFDPFKDGMGNVIYQLRNELLK